MGVNNITVHMGSNHTAIATCNVTYNCTIGDTIFYDNNGSGTQEPYEPGIAGVLVKLYKDDGNGVFNPSGGTDDLVAFVTTASDGSYQFTDCNCCTVYWVYVEPSTLPPYLTQTTGTNPWGPIILNPDGEYYGLADFGYQPPGPVGGEAESVNISTMSLLLACMMVVAGGAIVLRKRTAHS